MACLANWYSVPYYVMIHNIINLDYSGLVIGKTRNGKLSKLD